MPAFHRDQPPAFDRIGLPAWARLLRQAFVMLAERATTVAGRPLTVTVVSAECLKVLLDDLEALCRSTTGDVRRIAGRDLGGQNPLGRRQGLVIVDRIDELAPGEAQQAAAAFLDDLMRHGVPTCVTIGRSPAAANLVPGLESRLAASLIVHVPVRPSDQPTSRTSWSVPRIVRTAARCHGLPAAALMGSGRSRSVVQARNLAMYLARQLTGSSFGTIGAAFGHRDHTTVMRGVRAIESRLAEDAAFAADVEWLLTSASGPPRRRPARSAVRRRSGVG